MALTQEQRSHHPSTAGPDTFFAPIGQAVQVAHEGQPSENGGEPCLADGVQEPGCDGVDTVESLCMDCGENGITTMLLTSIPFFKEVIIASFKCPHCNASNNSVQSAGQIQARGAIYTVSHLTTPKDMNRQVIKSEYCTVRFNELQLEIPRGKGKMSTVEGLLRDCADDLGMNQPVRKHTEPAVYEKIQDLLQKISSALEYRFGPLTIELEDITGNSFVEALGGLSDPHWSKREFNRTHEQNLALGIAPNDHDSKDLTKDFEGENPEEVYSFPTVCSSCGQTLETRMKKLDIPHFKEMILMSTNCHSCGYKDNEVKSGGAVSASGTKLELKVESKEDLSRDVLKSETASMSIPELGLQLNPGTLGGRFTTVEGLLTQVFEELDQKVFARGDSTTNHHAADNDLQSDNERITLEEFLGKLKQASKADIPYTIIIDDPLSNSYIQNIYAPDPDPSLEKTEYQRTFEQNEELGLNDMKTENY